MVKNRPLRKKSIFVGNFVSFRFVALLPKREQKIQQGACFSFRKDLGLSPFFCKSEKRGKRNLSVASISFCLLPPLCTV